MDTLSRTRALAAVLLGLSLSSVNPAAVNAASWSSSSAVSSVLNDARDVRLRGCGGRIGTTAPLRGNVALNQAAEHWARGQPLRSALDATGYRVEQSAALHVSGDEAALRLALGHELCKAVTNGDLRDIGAAQSGRDTWIIVGAAFAPPNPVDAADVRFELLRRINDARAHARRCGSHEFAATGPLRLDPALNLAATRHAQDMLTHDYFEHVGSDGSTPATRVVATGYRYRIVGENIALGAASAAEAVTGWLDSPGHCENIMDPRFTDMGAAFAANSQGTPRIYWVQELAAPH